MDPAGSNSLSLKLTPYEELLSKFFECPVCLSTMFPPIYRCNAGHSICKDCHQRVTMCPRCRLPRINKRAPPPLEKICLILRFPCKFEMEGCTFIGKANELQSHFDVCSFQLVKCPIRYWAPDCAWHNSEKKLGDHIRQDHPEKMRTGNFFKFKSEGIPRSPPHPIVFIHAHNIVFRAMWQSDYGKYKFAVNILEKSIADRYIYKLVILPPTGHQPTFSFTSECFKLKTDERKIYPGKCVFVHHSDLKSYFNSEVDFSYTLTIFKDKHSNSRSEIETVSPIFF